ncbi:hypothetical protein [Calothrix sp. PCC 7507]|uniref:hypothetical protein n=1 Tax=Calothrix sp. PCC 7507 TaxID=99598 RepID=UPI00029ED79A|nr:hypothetical protein [Calothrix sp. PCC 7507]AFY33502.1 hypothetical protein Cal7507_3090 [Calothrix sp. PCC 7507]
MSLSALQKFFLPPIIASIGVFSAMSFPLAALGDKQITIKFQEEPIFYGKMRDVAIPYVVLTTVLSIGTGVAAGAVCGWRHSSRKSVKFQQELFSLEQNLQEKETLLKELKLSESRLQVSGLKAFLDDEIPWQPTPISHTLPIAESQTLKVQTPAPIYEQPVNAVPHIATQENINKPVRTTAASSSGFASAQTFHGYAQTNVNSVKEYISPPEANQITITPSEFEELQKQLREMMFQMQAMQDNLRVVPQATNTEEKATDRFQVYYDTVNRNEVKIR